MIETEPEGDFVIVNLSENGKVVTWDFESQLYDKETLNRGLVSDDEAIAKELQEQIDREYDKNIRRLENLQNGTSKLNISYEKYRKYGNYDWYGDESEDDYNYEDSDWHRFEEIDRTISSIPRCGYAITKNGDMVTKHDVNLNGQRNMKRLMNLPLNIKTGDGAASHTKISNRVLNGLRRHSQNEEHHENMRRKEKHQHRHQKLHKLPTIDLYGVDTYTKGIIQGMMLGDKPLIKELYYVLAEGKEACVYLGRTSNLSSRRNCAIKIYKPTVCEKKLPEWYLDGDYRFSNRYRPDLKVRTVLSMWAEKEAENLKLLRKFGIPCPRVIGLKQNVLLMTIIEEKNVYRPQIMYRYYHMSEDELFNAYKQIVNYMVVMFRKAHLVHGDLTESNIFWLNHTVYLIDVSQAIDTSHEYAFDSLFKDCTSVTQFFNKVGVKNVMSLHALFEHITGIQFHDTIRLEKVRQQWKERRFQATT